MDRTILGSIFDFLDIIMLPPKTTSETISMKGMIVVLLLVPLCRAQGRVNVKVTAR